MERRLCRCFQALPISYVKQVYPACVTLGMRVDFGGEYWVGIIEAICKDYPEIAMEYYLVGEG